MMHGKQIYQMICSGIEQVLLKLYPYVLKYLQDLMIYHMLKNVQH
jgi:hypothetical protein